MTRSKFALSAAVVALICSGPAIAMDGAACKDFIVGTWNVTSAIPGEAVKKITYNADGTYQQGVEHGSAVPDPTAAGAWEAQDGDAADLCEVLVTPAKAAPRTLNLTKTGKDSFKTKDGAVYERTADASPALMN